MAELEQVSVGDKVCLISRGGFDGRIRTLTVGEVERVTATQITAFGRRWFKRSGEEVGKLTSWSNRLRLLTRELQIDADTDRAELDAESICYSCGSALTKLDGADAIKFAAMLPPELLALARSDK